MRSSTAGVTCIAVSNLICFWFGKSSQYRSDCILPFGSSFSASMQSDIFRTTAYKEARLPAELVSPADQQILPQHRVSAQTGAHAPSFCSSLSFIRVRIPSTAERKHLWRCVLGLAPTSTAPAIWQFTSGTHYCTVLGLRILSTFPWGPEKSHRIWARLAPTAFVRGSGRAKLARAPETKDSWLILRWTPGCQALRLKVAGDSHVCPETEAQQYTTAKFCISGRAKTSSWCTTKIPTCHLVKRWTGLVLTAIFMSLASG